MRSLPSFLLLGFASLSFMAGGCASTTSDADDEGVDSQSDEVKKKVKPKGGNGALELDAPAWSTAGFVGRYDFGSSSITPGGRVERVPGTYTLRTIAEGGLMGQAETGIPIVAGKIVKRKATGLRVRFAEPVTLGRTYVALAPESGNNGALEPGAAWRTKPEGASMFVLPGNFTVTTYTDGQNPRRFAIASGALEEVVIPTARVVAKLDAYDPDYPSGSCGTPSVVAGANNYTETAALRKADGSPNAGPFVVPQGPDAPAVLTYYGLSLSQPTVSGGTTTFTLNRLEVDDVEVNTAAGGTQMVKGSFSVERKEADGRRQPFGCSFTTHTGIDVPDGTYVVTSSASSPSGAVTHVEEVSFP